MNPKNKIAIKEDACVVSVFLDLADELQSYYRYTLFKAALLYIAGVWIYFSVRWIYHTAFLNMLIQDTLLLQLLLFIFHMLFLFLTVLFLAAVVIFFCEYRRLVIQKRTLLCSLNDIKASVQKPM